MASPTDTFDLDDPMLRPAPVTADAPSTVVLSTAMRRARTAAIEIALR